MSPALSGRTISCIRLCTLAFCPGLSGQLADHQNSPLESWLCGERCYFLYALVALHLTTFCADRSRRDDLQSVRANGER
jgi:hypothetical protein